jgi:hypothetical protein
VDALGIAPTATAEDASLQDGIPVFESSDAAQLYALVRLANAEKPISTLLPSVKADFSVGDVLTKTPAEASALLGGAQNYARFRSAYAAETKKAVESITAVAAPPPAGTAEAVQAALAQAGGDLIKALEASRAATGINAATRRYLEHAMQVSVALGSTRAKALAPFVTRRP